MKRAARAAKPAAKVSAPVEDYLKAIYELERNGAPAGTNEIALRLAIAPASVSGMIRRLARQRLLAHERYRGVTLTEAGRRVAVRIVRRHRVIEAYLTRALGFSWDRVHDEAERLEHAASEELVDRMAAAIGEPATDPHGAPIPTRDGRIVARPVLTLSALAPRERGRVVEVGDEDANRLRFLGEVGLTPGARVQMLERSQVSGAVRLRIGSREHTIGTVLADTVLVERAERA